LICATPLEFVNTLPLGGEKAANPEESEKVTIVPATGLPPLSFTVAVATTVPEGGKVIACAPVAASVKATVTLGFAAVVVAEVDPWAPPPPPPQPAKPSMLNSEAIAKNNLTRSFGMIVPGKKSFRGLGRT